jgi:hypothetical protein
MSALSITVAGRSASMRRAVIGGVAGVSMWLGAALAAEAQIDNTSTGPVSVSKNQTSSTYTSVVTCSTNFVVNLQVFLNGARKHNSNTSVANSGPTYNFSKVVSMVGWGMKAGDTLLYRGTATIPGTSYRDVDDWTVIVSGSTTYLVPDRMHLPAVDRDREEWA